MDRMNRDDCGRGVGKQEIESSRDFTGQQINYKIRNGPLGMILLGYSGYSAPEKTTPQWRKSRTRGLIFRPRRGSLILHSLLRLTPWAAFLRRFAAEER